MTVGDPFIRGIDMFPGARIVAGACLAALLSARTKPSSKLSFTANLFTQIYTTSQAVLHPDEVLDEEVGVAKGERGARASERRFEAARNVQDALVRRKDCEALLAYR